jgi:hypothetical protein
MYHDARELQRIDFVLSYAWPSPFDRNFTRLRAYTKSTGKIFRNTFDQADSNFVLRHLLRKILRGNLWENNCTLVWSGRGFALVVAVVGTRMKRSIHRVYCLF